MELRRLILRVVLGEKAPDWDEWIWSKCGYLFNEDSFITNVFLKIFRRNEGAALKVSVDFN